MYDNKWVRGNSKFVLISGISVHKEFAYGFNKSLYENSILLSA